MLTMSTAFDPAVLPVPGHTFLTSQRHTSDEPGLSEGALLAAHAGLLLRDGADLAAVRLRDQWPALMAGVAALGEVVAQTCNAACVHEKTGVYHGASHSGQVGLVLGGEIDLRVFYRHWAHGYAVCEMGASSVQRSLQFFDAAGHAVHKIMLTPRSDLAAYDALVAHQAASDQQPGMCVQAPPSPQAEQPDAQVDVAGLRAGWASLHDTHDFFLLLKKYAVSRLQALRLAEPRFVQQLDAACVLDLLRDAAQEQVAITALVGNAGMLQLHTGQVHKVLATGPWITVADARFRLQLCEDDIASAWVVRKPTVDGLVTSVEVYDHKGDAIVMLSGARKPGAQELCAWRHIVDKAAWEDQLCAA